MQRCIVTSFDKQYWQDWGASWVASLKELAKYKGKVIIINLGDLPFGALGRLKELGFNVIPAVRRFDRPPLDRFVTLGLYARDNPGYYAYWEADAYFQADVDGVFEGSRLACTIDRSNLPGNRFHAGFLSGPSPAWEVFGNFLTFAADFGNTSDQDILNDYCRCFGRLVDVADDHWNCTDLANLKWRDGFYLGETLAKVVHPAGPFKQMSDGRQYLFSEKYKNLHDDWHAWLIMGNTTSARSILKKTGKHLSLKKNSA